jgi:hypothetical protein
MPLRRLFLAFAGVSVVLLPAHAGVGRARPGQNVLSTTPTDARREISGAWVFNNVLSDRLPGSEIAESLVIRFAGDAVTFYRSDGSRHVYHVTGRRERQDLGAGDIWTTAELNGATLRLRFERENRITILQTFFFDRLARHLIVTTSLDQDQPVSAIRLVYDELIDREP